MKLITNTSLQSWSFPLFTEKGMRDYYLAPKETIKVPASYITDHVIRFQKRNLLSIRNA